MPTRETGRILTWIAMGFTATVLLLELLHHMGYADRLHTWATQAVQNTQAPDPLTFIGRAVSFFRTCFLKTNCSPDRPTFSVEPCGHFIGCVSITTISAIDYAISGTPHAGLLGSYTVAYVIVLAALVAIGITRSQNGGFIGWFVTFVIVALFGGGAFLWALGWLLHGAYVAIGGVAAWIIFIGANAIALHFSILMFEGTVEVTTKEKRP